MNPTFTCKKCGGNTFEQFSQTQIRCLQCSEVSVFDTGYRVVPEFLFLEEKKPLSTKENIIYKNAPYIKRFVNYLIDSLFMGFFISILSIIANIDISKIHIAVLQISLLTSMVIYYTLMEFAFGKTVGKFFTKTRVIATDGNRLSVVKCIIRSVCRIIPIDFISGFIFNGSFWHDSIANTMVIED